MFFDSLFNKYKLDKKKSVMIGNDWIADMKSAYDYGIDSIYIHTDISPSDTVLDDVKAKYIIEDGNIGNIRKFIL